MHRKDSVVAARFCEGGHRCLPPKECCAQGCCYLYAPPSAPRTPTPATDHVLNLFFINHWYFWCFLLAIVLALLCACSLWKKRRQLCGWGSPGHHSQSEGDSAGSCYAPPQYSRCNSFHIHAPPPYTEVTSKPDLYPLVFSYTGDTAKAGGPGGGGTNYLMVQYFRNYIVRPVGSLSGASTVDSLSSSFICTANEANTLIPPPYSRAASPDHSISIRNYSGMPRSASQQACTLEGASSGHRPNSVPNSNYYGGFVGGHGFVLRASESAQFNNILSNGGEGRSGDSGGRSSEQSGSSAQISGSQSDHYRFSVHNSNTNNNSVASEASNPMGLVYAQHHAAPVASSNHSESIGGSQDSVQPPTASEDRNNSNANGNASTHRNSLANANIYSSCGSIGGISITIPANSECGYQDLNALRQSLETCCQILQQKQAQFRNSHQQPSSGFTANSEDSPINIELAKKFEGLRSSYIGSNTGSNVSSLANLGTPDSPPRATSPTLEVRELLEQIRQLQNVSTTNSASEGIIVINPQPQPSVDVSATVSNSSININNNNINNNNNNSNSNASSVATASPSSSHPARRPSSLTSKKKFFSKHPSQGSSLGGHKALYIPISSNNNNNSQSHYPTGDRGGRSLWSPSSAASAAAIGLLSRGRSRCIWMSKSAPTTPGTGLPPGGAGGAGGAIGDNSPLLLDEQDEDGEQNV
ncbi:homeobox protein 5 isoform X2 [Malaya genurostris]|uniref:homeobox protein 5 isoform X2 n=1 Tax=Malaya genurostris TaxID=325434 RepID=UPI0026F3E810|nr:homeobox protein 5 isoform X2 [Malaya genurostris]XP_058443614.1 homeobox protein 5 isoform X2 [Malaya genurostris]XP_058443615.1 homeobox protein 5 isoform X2 [Malaya genurostris]XP_058443616.1 homeobox protein 5 isoform X2 [Malaya genurostris]XP_058443617.1 homeobox protein 5 isoform X2 [Malaya genurostris]